MDAQRQDGLWLFTKDMPHTVDGFRNLEADDSTMKATVLS